MRVPHPRLTGPGLCAMEILVLGSGTSHGVPVIGCHCPVCLSSNPKNRRFRASILVRNANQAILIDTPPELRLQAITFGVHRVDAVLFTHTHADHLFGLDDLRRFNDILLQDIPVYGDAAIQADIRRAYDYIFRQTQSGGGKPCITLHDVLPEFTLCGLHIQSFYVLHGQLPVLAYRFRHADPGASPASFAYVTDVSYIPPESMEQLRNLDLLFLDAVQLHPHPTHVGLNQALEVIEELQPRRAYLTHLSHYFDHDAVNAQLPSHVQLAYDGLTIAL
ncbi:MAG: MBL fold metallo-hydrolase [Chthonomonadaceae bacterium]|nr:MBL fold metallo-hydrolase [Chthonomonadaceae bacterium]